ncbi:trypsin-like peptidase domain-containing protein [Microbispora rosea]|uniref:trypsin-like peptidase domain-containing protein n=1 Tax=Microbispora rosea TaxID=58117 RepID=UPI003426E64C
MGLLLAGDRVAGTCFQTEPGILVTAWHVLNELAAGATGAVVQVASLDGGMAFHARVQRTDPVHDLAVLSADGELAESVADLVDTDLVDSTTDVTVTGAVEVLDQRYTYRWLTTSGVWQGVLDRHDHVMDRACRVGWFTSRGVMPGMSGSPVRRLSDDAVVGMVSERYLSPDDWLRNTVWVVRIESLRALLTPVSPARPMPSVLVPPDLPLLPPVVLLRMAARRRIAETMAEMMTTEESREDFIECIAELLGTRSIDRGRNPVETFRRVVSTCLERTYGLDHLLQVLRQEHGPQSIGIAKITMVIGSEIGEPALSRAEEDALLTVLKGIRCPDRLARDAWAALERGEPHPALSGALDFVRHLVYQPPFPDDEEPAVITYCRRLAELLDENGTHLLAVVARIGEEQRSGGRGSGGFRVRPEPEPVRPAPRWWREELQLTEGRVLGRKKELSELSAAWHDRDSHILVLEAWTGVGKTALVNEWLDRLRDDPLPRLERVIGWSFNNRLLDEATVGGSEFVRTVLRWLGDPAPDSGSVWARGERLAHLLQEQRTLLILDGLESLLVGAAPSAIVDPSIATMLTELAGYNNGLCVITTRERIAGLEASARHVRVRNLGEISVEAGRDVLRVLGVRADDTELEEAAREFGLNALAIQLLARYLVRFSLRTFDWRSIPPDRRAESEGGQARRVLRAWQRHQGDDSDEVQLLRILGLFDRPVNEQELAPVVDMRLPGLSDRLPPVESRKWQALIDRLRWSGLVAPPRGPGDPLLDSHPLVRGYFAEQLKREPELWRVANAKIFGTLRESMGDAAETTAERLRLYRALRHATSAGEFEAAMQLHWTHIRCCRRHFRARDYSLLATDLAMWTSYFARPWTQLRKEVSHFGLFRPYIFSEASWNLFCMGRAVAAVSPARAALRESVKYKQWLEASGIAANLSTLLLASGRLRQARQVAMQAIEHADNPERNEWLGPWPEPTYHRTKAREHLAHVLLCLGRLNDAERVLLEAESIGARSDTGDDVLRGLGAYSLGEILLRTGRVGEALDRARHLARTRALRTDDDGPEVNKGLELLALGRALLTAHQMADALISLNEGTETLRRVGRADFVMTALLSRARAHRVAGQIVQARRDLDMAHATLERTELVIARADAYLEEARTRAAGGDWTGARESLAAGKAIADETGYALCATEITDWTAATPALRGDA